MSIFGVGEVAGLFGKAFGLIGEVVEDKDKRNEINMEIMKIINNLSLELLKTKTIPWVDALVKILLTINTLLKSQWRPVGSVCMAIFGGFCLMTGIEIPVHIQTMLFGAPIGWGLSRHVSKKNGEK